MTSLEHIGSGLYLAPSTADRWRDAGSPVLYNERSAWRSRAVQADLREDYLDGTGPYAAPPGFSNHEKGAAFDLRYPTSQARRRCIAAGLVPDGAEDWHFNDPDASAMPIIPSLALAGFGIRPLNESELFMPKVICDTSKPEPKYPYAVWDGIFGFDFITGTAVQQRARRERKKEIIGQEKLVYLSGAAFEQELADVNANRAAAGMPAIVRPS